MGGSVKKTNGKQMNPHPIDNGMTQKAGPGRKKGVPNKTTREIREALQYMVEKQLDKLEDAFNKVYEQDPGRFLALYERFCNFVLPKQQSVEISNEKGFDIEKTVEDFKSKLEK